MARPTKPKDLKPKADGDVAPVSGPAPAGGGGAAFDLKFIVLVVIIVLSSILGSGGSAYLMSTMFLMPEIQKLSAASGGAAEEGHGESGGHGAAPANQVGMNLELDEFMVNLKPDPNIGGNQYLRSKMALSIRVPAAEDCYAQAAEHALLPGSVLGGTVVGAAAPVNREMLASGGAPAGPSCEDIFKTNMAKYVPTMRDVINASLMKRTATVLATLEGQEALKDEVREQLNQIMAPNYEVLRINFQDFIIQR